MYCTTHTLSHTYSSSQLMNLALVPGHRGDTENKATSGEVIYIPKTERVLTAVRTH